MHQFGSRWHPMCVWVCTSGCNGRPAQWQPLLTASSEPLLTHICICVRTWASRCVCVCFVVIVKYRLRDILDFPPGCLLLQLQLEMGNRRSSRATAREEPSQHWSQCWRSHVMISVTGYVISLVFCYLLNLNLMIWNMIPTPKLPYPFKVPQSPEERTKQMESFRLQI